MRRNERREPRVEALPGSLHLQLVKCGKSNCRCASGEGHAAYYRFWREGGCLRKVYVRRADLDAVRAGLKRWRECRAVCRSLVSGPDLANVLREQRENLRAAGVEPPRRFYPARRVEDAGGESIEELAGRLVEPFPLTMFRFGGSR